MNHTKELVRMANQIATHFATYPREEAVAETAGHIRKFWDPRMRAGLLAHAEAGGADLHEVARSAVGVLQQAR
ncbi:formate dehydrogenase subunit delta [Azospirillum agricola]|uniref:formate dehydrogenase subunit delta n=1 Tax=Azospirillum agricola TaxID=1720247 RepID=UPI000A0F194E|nr:formate dehydrogenase subunit delta [Azospirillum agricola]MBP2231125.1 formate dehydrogenase subunit delta [Azospirillum agricola]SMH48313.1 formate dehydrogenase delta subunit [Azospirillum lipoferum]